MQYLDHSGHAARQPGLREPAQGRVMIMTMQRDPFHLPVISPTCLNFGVFASAPMVLPGAPLAWLGATLRAIAPHHAASVCIDMEARSVGHAPGR